MRPGTRVRVVAEGPWFNETGTIVNAVDSVIYDWRVRLDDGGTVIVEEREIEALP